MTERCRHPVGKRVALSGEYIGGGWVQTKVRCEECGAIATRQKNRLMQSWSRWKWIYSEK